MVEVVIKLKKVGGPPISPGQWLAFCLDVERIQARIAYLRQIEKRFGPPKLGRPKSKAYPPDWYVTATGRS